MTIGTKRVMLALVIIFTVIAALVALALPARASHVSDGGVDEAWVVAMNQETYWESRFATAQQTVECTKYDNHSGAIPESYEAAVIKDGNFVRVYAGPIGPAFTALGAVNPANGQHFAAPHSWVMKCDYFPVTTTTTVPEDDDSTTTTTSTTSTTSTTVPETTTTTVQRTTTTTQGTTTTRPVFPTFTPSIACEEQVGLISVDFDVADFSRIDLYEGDPDDTIEASLFEPGSFDFQAEAGVKYTVVGTGVGFTTATLVPEWSGCDEVSTTTTTLPTSSTLPFTGLGDHLPVVAALLLSIGSLVLLINRMWRERGDES